MKLVMHSVATVAVVLVTTFCVLVQVADLDHAIDGIESRSSAVVGQ